MQATTKSERAREAVHEPLPPVHTRRSACRWFWLTVKLVPYHAINFALGIVGFVVVIPGVCISLILLPFCGLGIIVYMLFLQFVRLLAVVDVLLVNFITPSRKQVRWKVPDDSDNISGLRLATKLSRFSMRSSLVVLYFATVKFVIGLASIIAVALPFVPIVTEFVRDYASDTVNSLIPYNPRKFNFGTNPFLYLLTVIGYTIVGVVLMHLVGRISRMLARRVCCEEFTTTETSVVKRSDGLMMV